MRPNFLARLLEKFTGSVRTLRIQTANPAEEHVGELNPLLVEELFGLSDFVRNDPEDTIFEEFDSPFPPATPFGWKPRRPAVVWSVIRSVWTVVQLTLCGTFIGAVAVGLFYIVINTMDACHWVHSADALSRTQFRMQVVGHSLQGFVLEFWQFLILWTIFKWPLLKELNLLIITLFVAFVDFSSLPLLKIFDAGNKTWSPYLFNVYFLSITLYSSFAIGRRMHPTKRLDAWGLAIKLCIQFLLGLPVACFSSYFLFERFAEIQPGLQKALFAVVAPMIILPVKLISRQCAIHLDGVNHPGTSHALVAVVFGASIVSRTMQAGMERLELFVGLSFVHGVLHVAERATVPLRDYYWNKLALSICCSCCCRTAPHYNVRSPRSQRLTADMTIQGILLETISIVYSISVLYAYYFAYGMPANWPPLLVDMAKRIPCALVLEVVFSSIVVLFQTRYMNIPVLRVWTRNWREHVTLAVITTFMTVVFFTQYQLPLLRTEYQRRNETFPLVGNCTDPFSGRRAVWFRGNRWERVSRESLCPFLACRIWSSIDLIVRKIICKIE